MAFTQSGDSARRLARYRGRVPVLAFTPVAKVRSQLSLSWGVETFLITDVEHTDEMVRQVDEALLEIGRVSEGDQVVIIAGSPARHPRLHQRPAHPPDGRRHPRGRPGLPPPHLSVVTAGVSLAPASPRSHGEADFSWRTHRGSAVHREHGEPG